MKKKFRKRPKKRQAVKVQLETRRIITNDISLFYELAKKGQAVTFTTPLLPGNLNLMAFAAMEGP
ncbi:hypothetical protein COV49_02810 [Candidatus Falkowbacteria bacterium CG11_big_fil_rev_8_21_14_0_20_39_10]|uniref:Uncharacterized protein n=1 Tax=Candidatus Falkowbacteria bacterium CG11_big_fil_rev_8_21_14_0_20_39_10 TaxID=1974570 RepID=A0A2M6K8X3_9BACT|nr:MAG: hypothetical protein COV49_02810 [Candidatus Falkowbacteria bacterium CG11_big_fil_rev_8_21_14_0_20_39_10]